MAAGQAQLAGTTPAGGTLLADFLSRRKGGQQADVRRARLRPALGAAFRAAVREEIERGRGLIWAAFVFAGGIAVYFALPAEPMALATAGAALVVWLAFLVQAGRGREATPLLVVALLLSGMAAGANDGTGSGSGSGSIAGPAAPRSPALWRVWSIVKTACGWCCGCAK